MKPIIITGPPRAAREHIEELQTFGVATVHEALGRVGLVGPNVRPIQDGTCVAGSAVTVLCWPGDNLMIHAAVEQCHSGDFLVVTTSSPSLDGAFGELFATALRARGVVGLVTTTGVRDVKDLRAMRFPVWSGGVHAQGTVKATAGSVNIPIVVGSAVVRAGDVIIADDDGVLCVPREEVSHAIESSRARVEKEIASRAAFAAGELSLDRGGLRGVLSAQGVRYVPAKDYEDE